MTTLGSLPENLKNAVDHGVLKRLPITFLPFANQQLNEWDFLFPNERQSTQRLLLYVDSLSAEDSATLFEKIIDFETKMEVRKWRFSTSEQTIENASLLARSPYYQEWRNAVQAVFDSADRFAQTSGAQAPTGNRLVLLSIPRSLPIDTKEPWRNWQKLGRPLELDASHIAESEGVLEHILNAPADASGATFSLLDMVSRSGNNTADAWVLDAGRSLVDILVAQPAAAAGQPGPILLGYSRLDQYRENFSHEMNTMRKDLSDADAVYDRLRKVDVRPWCPPEAQAPAVREYLRSLYLSGNGAVIFGNSFVQWGAAEALRRARPRLLAARFGVRPKPKPFTGVAVFDNPDQINPLPPVNDLPGSAIDAQILALYIWLAATRYSEYQSKTACVCIAESLAQIYLVAPSEFPVKADSNKLSVAELARALHDWIA